MRTRSSRTGITRRRDREVILIGEERILDESPSARSKTPAEARLDVRGKRWSGADLSVSQELRAPSTGPAEESAMPPADLVALVTSRWADAEAKAQERAQEGRRIQKRELDDAKAILGDAIETRHAASERELRAALAELQERADEISRRAEAEAARNAKLLADELDERAAASERRLEEALAGDTADLLKRHESLGERISEERSRSLQELESRFNEWAAETEERLDAAITNTTRCQAPSVAEEGVIASDSEPRPTVSNAPSRRSAVAGGLALATLAALLLHAGNSDEPARGPKASPAEAERTVRATGARKEIRMSPEAQRGRQEDQGSSNRERSSGPASQSAPVPEVEVAAPSPASSAAAPPVSAPSPPTEQPVSEPEPEPANESEVQQEFGP
ncbi:MAG: hypothetical protein WKH68_02220 [Candidatus Limnocylindria bacterium]